MGIAGAADKTLSDAVARGVAPGAIAMATDASGTLYEGAFGVRELGGSRPMETGTVCWLHSMTKPITAACVMQLVEQGRIGLDDDCGRWCEALASPRVLQGFDGDGQPILRPAKGTITLRRLLTHTAGFVYDMWNADMGRYMTATRISRQASFEKPGNCQPLAFDPGTRWQYGINIDWAGKVLEAITGETLDAYMQKNLLGPLGMHSTGYKLRPEITARLSGVHQRHADGRLEAVPFDPPQRERDFTGGGGLYGTAGDYMRFIRMILNGGELDGVRVLKPETVAEMGRNHMGELNVEILLTARPDLSADANFFPDQTQKWGLSFLINTEDVPGRRSAGSLAWAGLRNTYFWIDPKRGIGGALLTQFLPFADPAVLRLFEAFERDVYAGTA